MSLNIFLFEILEAPAAEKKQKWRELEQVFQPGLGCEGNSYMKGGGCLHLIANIYPIYFIV
jgi:hypothetical protein